MTPPRTTARPLRWVGCLAWVLLGVSLFLAGVAVERYVLAGRLAAAAETPDGLNAALLDEARRVIQENFVDREAATDERLQTGALSRCV